MKYLVAAFVFLFFAGLAWAQVVPPDGGSPPGQIIAPIDRDPGTGPGVILNLADADGDGFVASVDCNDDDPLINPGAIEVADGVDNNCDGAVDEGFDTTIDWPALTVVKAIWPDPAVAVDVSGAGTEAALGQHVSTVIPPRLVWAGDRFIAVWVDVRNRLRAVPVHADGTVLGGPITLSKQAANMDVAWTGSRLGIVYEEFGVRPARVWLTTLDHDLMMRDEVVLAAVGSEPKIAWGQDRFGVVWNSGPGPNSLRFQRFGSNGEPLSAEEVLVNSGGKSSIVFDGTIVKPQSDGSFALHEGMFGVAYEAHYGFAASGDVLLTAFPRDPASSDPVGPVRVNQRNYPPAPLGAMPAISANQTGFLVAWHITAHRHDGARARFFSHDTLTPVQELIPDADAARYGRLAWTGSEFVMMNDNRTSTATEAYDVHLRRFDASGNTHPTAPAGAWSEVNLRKYVRGDASVHPDLAVGNGVLGGIWVERDPVLNGAAGRLWFTRIEHK